MIARSSPPSVLVVGAGPAGATAARVLAAGGATVRILDRSAFPRNKPCGGGISMRALARFPYLERELSRIATHVVSRLHLEGPDGDSTVIESRRPATLMVRRIEFDALLLSLDLPQAGGLAAVRALRAWPPPIARLPLLALRDGMSRVQEKDWRDAGCDALLHWPGDLDAVDISAEALQAAFWEVTLTIEP